MTRYSRLRKTILVVVLLSATGLACRGFGLGAFTTKEQEPFVAEDWSIEWIEQQVEGDEYSGLAGVAITLDSKGCPYVAYGGRQPRYASRCAGIWETGLLSSVAKRTGSFSTAVNQEDTLFIAYYASTEGHSSEVRYATVGTESVLEETMVSASLGSGHPALVLLPSGDPALVYDDENEGQLLFAVHTDDDWETEVITDGLLIAGTSLGVDRMGTPWVLFEGHTASDITLYAAHRNGNRWVFDELYETWGDRVSLDMALALDEGGAPHILFVDLENWRLTYGARQGTEWHFEEVVSGPEGASRPSSPALAMGTDDRVYACYTESNSHSREIVFAWSSHDGWQHSIVERNKDLGLCAIAVDDAGGIHLAYSRGDGYQVRYAYHLPME